LFLGTSIAVYGVFSWYNLGSLTVTYSIDGSPSPISVTTSTISVTPTSPNYLRNDGDFSNYLYFGLDSLPSGSHTLLVNITEAKNQTFMLDYITYKPSFSTLSSMPSLSNISSGTTRPGASTTSSSSKPQRSVSTGAIVGGVIGGLAFVFLVLMLFLFFRRRARKRDYAYHEATPSASINYPSCTWSSPPCCSFPLIYLCLRTRFLPTTQFFRDARESIISTTARRQSHLTFHPPCFTTHRRETSCTVNLRDWSPQKYNSCTFVDHGQRNRCWRPYSWSTSLRCSFQSF